jgi:hypothetical protein
MRIPNVEKIFAVNDAPFIHPEIGLFGYYFCGIGK